MLLLGMFAMYSFLAPTLPTEPETPHIWESVDGQKFTREGYPAIPDNTEVLWWDWDVDYPPGTRRAFFVKGQLKREKSPLGKMKASILSKKSLPKKGFFCEGKAEERGILV